MLAISKSWACDREERRSTGEITVAAFPETLGPEKERQRSSKVLETQ